MQFWEVIDSGFIIKDPLRQILQNYRLHLLREAVSKNFFPEKLLIFIIR